MTRLLEKAEGHLEYLRLNEALLRSIPVGALEERRSLWEPLAALIRRAMDDASLEIDARLEADRV